MARRTAEEAELTREALLTTAQQVFAEKGYSATTLAEIVTRAGLTKGALFHHFKSKEALFIEVWTRLQTEMDQSARAAAIAAFDDPDPYAAFLAGSHVYLKRVLDQDYRQIVLIDGPSVLGLSRWYERDSKLGRDNVRAGIRYLIKMGRIAPEREADLTILMQSILNAAGFALARNEPDVTMESLFGAYEVLLRNAC